jgi:hypothetical protein
VGETLRVVRVSVQPCFERPNRVTQRRLRYTELRGGLGKAAFAGYGQESDEVAYVGTLH